MNGNNAMNKTEDMVSARELADMMELHYNTILMRIYKRKIKFSFKEKDPVRYWFSKERVKEIMTK